MPKDPAPASLEDRVTRLEEDIKFLIAEVAEVAAARVVADQKDWPRRTCDKPGCKVIMRHLDAAQLPKFCPEHTEAA